MQPVACKRSHLVIGKQSHLSQSNHACSTSARNSQDHDEISMTSDWSWITAALSWRAQQFGMHSATLLQNLIKKPGMSPYDGEHGKIALEMEERIYEVLLESLYAFKPQRVHHTAHIKKNEEVAQSSISDVLRFPDAEKRIIMHEYFTPVHIWKSPGFTKSSQDVLVTYPILSLMKSQSCYLLEPPE